MARDLDPFSPLMNRDYGRSLRYAGRCGEALEAARTAVELDPAHWVTYDVIRNCSWETGRFEEAVEAAARWFEMGGLEDAVAPLRQAWITGGARGVLEFEADLFRANGRHYLAAMTYAELGRLDDAFDELFAAIDAGTRGHWSSRSSPFWSRCGRIHAGRRHSAAWARETEAGPAARRSDVS